MATTGICASCGKPLAPSAPQGLCAQCLIQVGLGSGIEIGPETQSAGGRPPFAAPTPEEVAKLFTQLEILSFLGQGGMGAVYQARQKELDRVVALKILPPDIGADPAFAERFTREARALARLNHPGVVTLYEFGRADGLYFFLMEFVDGVNLRQLLEAGRLSAREALAIVPQICDALQYAHDQGIVHRDIKPENILLDRHGRVKVADFGLAKLVGGAGEHAASTPAQPAGVPAEGAPPPEGLTEAGKVMGTPHYMAPEQVERPQEVDHRADIYSLGVVFYQMLTGELPHQRLEPPSRKVQIDVRLDEVVLRALEKKPERRYQHASEVKTAVETIAGTIDGARASVSEAYRKPAVLPSAIASLKDDKNEHRSTRRVLAASAALLGIFALGWFVFATNTHSNGTAAGALTATKPLLPADTQGAISQSTLALGPEHEREIRSGTEPQRGTALDLDSGQVIEMAAEIERAPAQQRGEWMYQQHVELAAIFDGPRCSVLAKDTTLKPLPQDKLKALQVADLRYTVAAGAEAAGPQIDTVILPDAGLVRFDLPPQAELPFAFAFQTAAGNLGLIEFVRVTEAARTLHLRYRLVQEEDRKP